ncbi:MAG: YidH family protein [Candidatus Bipolaricaulaceae bacterium]
MTETQRQICDEHTILRDRLAAERTALAAERTLLAYVRTALALVAAGVSFIRFFPTPTMIAVGWGLVPVGAATLAVGGWRFLQCRRRTAALRGGRLDR